VNLIMFYDIALVAYVRNLMIVIGDLSIVVVLGNPNLIDDDDDEKSLRQKKISFLNFFFFILVEPFSICYIWINISLCWFGFSIFTIPGSVITDNRIFSRIRAVFFDQGHTSTSCWYYHWFWWNKCLKKKEKSKLNWLFNNKSYFWFNAW